MRKEGANGKHEEGVPGGLFASIFEELENDWVQGIEPVVRLTAGMERTLSTKFRFGLCFDKAYLGVRVRTKGGCDYGGDGQHTPRA